MTIDELEFERILAKAFDTRGLSYLLIKDMVEKLLEKNKPMTAKEFGIGYGGSQKE